MTVERPPLVIGNIPIDPPVLSAPMAGLSDRPWRRLLRSLEGPGLIETEMVSARAFVHLEQKGEDLPARLQGVETEERPLAVQIWDNDPVALAQTAVRLVQDYHVSIIDMNFGCPAPKIVRNSSSGSWLLRDPNRVGELVGQVVQAVFPVPVMAKIRLGLTQGTINAIDVAQAIEGAGAAALTVHGRTTSQMYTGNANWDEIAKIKPYLKRIPLIGNGDIKMVEDAIFRLQNYPIDGIMIGRGALERPWIFRQIREALAGLPVSPTPSLAEQKEILLRHFQYSVEDFPVEKAVSLMRRFACFYSKNKPGGRSFRYNICSARTKDEFMTLVDTLFQ